MKTTLLALTTTAAITAALFAQGDLNPPPGGPSATMKTLDQLEARTPIPKSPATPVAGPHFTITASGSYYLTGNITVSTGSAIVVADGINNVTLNLNGFTIASALTGSASGTAIELLGNPSGVSISHGNISSGTTVTSAGVVTPAGFENGIDGPDRYFYPNALVTQVHVSGVASNGIRVGQGTVTECNAINCGGSGIVCETITNSIANRCGIIGISAVTATNCSGDAASTYGISCNGNAINCSGSSYNGTGLSCYSNATNCSGTSVSSNGFECRGNATNCTGSTNNTNYSGISVDGTASFCRGENTNGGRALYAAIAIGCTSVRGTISSPSKQLGTP